MTTVTRFRLQCFVWSWCGSLWLIKILNPEASGEKRSWPTESPDKKIPDFDNFSKGFFEIIKNCKKLLSLTVNINKRRNPPNASPSLRGVEFFPVRKDEREREGAAWGGFLLLFLFISQMTSIKLMKPLYAWIPKIGLQATYRLNILK